MRSGGFKKNKAELVLREMAYVPCGHGGLSFLLFGPPPAGAEGACEGGCAPWRGPLCTPPVYPQSFPITADWRGLRGFCSGSFLAPLGDLPARRAMPACTFALNERSAKVPHYANVRLRAEWGSLAVTQATHSSQSCFSGKERGSAGGGVIKNRSRHVGEVRA